MSTVYGASEKTFSKSEFATICEENGIPIEGTTFEELQCNIKPGEVLVRFETAPDGRTPTRVIRESRLQQLSGAQVLRDYRAVPGLSRVRFSGNQTMQEVLTLLNNTPGILYAEPDYRIEFISTFPDDPTISDDFDDPNNLLWGLHNIGQT